MKRLVILTSCMLVASALTSTQANANIEILQKTGNAFKQIAKDSLPAVVFIDVQTTVEVRTRSRYHSHPFEEFFGRGYRQPQAPQTRKYKQEGQGSGFIITEDGYILTNNHVVNGADKITVTLADGSKFKAKLIGTDPKSEVALIKIEDDKKFPTIQLGDSDKLEVGDWVLAAGNPFGLSQTVTAGIVSAKERNNVGIAEYENFIQTDAAINPGNSGGPLLNIKGEAIGINTAIYSRSGGYMGIGFAIPINTAIGIKDQLIKDGKVSRSVLGVYIQEIDETLAESFELKESSGILISQVIEDSAAEAAGIKSGDIIVEMNGEKVGKVGAFRNKVSSTPPNSKVKLRIFRDGKYKEITAITKELEDDGTGSGSGVTPEEFDRMGLSIDDLDEETAERLGYDELTEGVVITNVEQDSPASRAGLQPGQIIQSINRISVDNVSEFKKALKKIESLDTILLLVKDPRGSRFVVLNAE